MRRNLIRIQRPEVCLDNPGKSFEIAYFLSNFNNLAFSRQFGYGSANSQRIAHGARMIRTRAAPVKEPLRKKSVSGHKLGKLRISSPSN